MPLLNRTLTRRALLMRIARAAPGLGAALLVGCGESGGAPADVQPRPTEPQDAPQPEPQPEPELQPQPQDAAASRAEAVQAAPAARAAQVQQVQPAPAPAAAVQAADAPRRRLVPNLECADCALEEPAFTPLAGAEAQWGVIEGAGYRIEVPERWNGALVLWAHGFSGLNDSGTDLTKRLSFSMPPARELLIGLGYAWATSTYRAPGYVPGLGVDELLIVKDRVAERYRAPRQTLCAGGSMGGATAQLMAQEFPEELTGAVAFCGALGNVWVADYLAAWHTLALWLIGAPPQRLDAAGLVQWARPLGAVDARGRLQLSEAGERFAALIEQLTGGPRWAFREGLAAQWNTSFSVGALTWPSLIESAPFAPGQVIDLGEAAIPIDTTGFEFGAADSAGLDTERLNAEVLRIASSPQRRRDPGVGAPSGRLEVPLLCLKTTGDLYTPIHLDRDYQRLVEASGYGGNLAARAVRRAGHCSFTASEAAAALSALAAWVDYGAKPLGEDLSGDLATAGVNFTLQYDADDPLRPGAGS